MLRAGRHLAVVRDEDGATAHRDAGGLLEELVGDIRDEHDEPDPRRARRSRSPRRRRGRAARPRRRDTPCHPAPVNRTTS
jgi:Mg2+/Co2+ transporter CorC